jgi:hypothetical protein
MTDVGSLVYYFSQRDNDYFVGEVIDIIQGPNPRYVLGQHHSVDGYSFHYFNEIQLRAEQAFATLDAAKKHRLINRLRRG